MALRADIFADIFESMGKKCPLKLFHIIIQFI